MSLQIAGRPCHSPSDVSERARLILALIRNGEDWLDWAISQSDRRFRFGDEQSMLKAVQDGLHDSPLTFLPRLGLLVGPAKLMALGAAELEMLIRAERGSGAASPELRAMLDAHELDLESDLAAGRQFLEALGISDAPLFQSLGLDALKALLRLEREQRAQASPEPLAREAAAFALQQSCTPFAFIDYFRAWLALSVLPGWAARTPAERFTVAQATLDGIARLAFVGLDSPRVDAGAPGVDVEAAVMEWMMTGRRVGFWRISLAVQQLVAHGGCAGRTGDEAAECVRQYMAAAAALLAAGGFGAGTMDQDGVSRRFRLAGAGSEILLETGSDGLIAMAHFGPPVPAVRKSDLSGAGAGPSRPPAASPSSR